MGKISKNLTAQHPTFIANTIKYLGILNMETIINYNNIEI